MRNTELLVALLIYGFVLSGCKQEPVAPPARPAVANQKPDDLKTLSEFLNKDAPAPDKSAALPPGHPPIGGAQPPAPMAGGMGNGTLPPGHPGIGAPQQAEPEAIKFEAPAAWKSEPPSNGMRKAQYVIPRAKGDAEDGHMIVFYFGKGQGGDINQNIARWRGMFSTADGKPVPDSAFKQETKEVSGMKVTTIQATGRYIDPMASGGPAAPQTDSLMLAAIIEAPQGSWFFKGVGPVATMRTQLDNFNKFVSSVKKK